MAATKSLTHKVQADTILILTARHSHCQELHSIVQDVQNFIILAWQAKNHATWMLAQSDEA